jgi:hypothetical protein
MLYECSRCLKYFDKKSNYNQHLARKIQCKEIFINNDKSEEILPQNSSILLKNPQNSSILLKNSHKIINKTDNMPKNNLKCQYCNKIYSRSDNLTRHMEKFCKKTKKIIEQENEQNEKISILSKEIEKLKNQLLESTNKKNNIINNNSHNTNSNNQLINNQHNINIKMVAFGDEDISRLTEEEILKIVKSKKNAFFNLIKSVHLNKRLPEYNNVLFNNLKSDYGSIFDENKLIVKKKKQIIYDLINNRLTDFEQLIEKYKQSKHLTKRDFEILGEVIQFLKNSNDDEDIDGNIIRPDKETSKKTKDLYEEIIYIFYNDRDLVEKTFKQIAQKENSDESTYLDI